MSSTVNKFTLFNQSSESMNHTFDKTVDLIIAGPPYNIGTKYGINGDLMPLANYTRMLNRIFSECHRVLKNDGRLIIESADSIYSDGKYIQLAGLIQSICLKIGFHIESRHINFAMSKEHVELVEHNWNKDYTTSINAHSNCHQFLVFKKKKTIWKEGKIFYFKYKSAEGHPCPFPVGTYTALMDMYFKKGFTVLDPFAGTARMGVEVIKKGGAFIGYELNSQFYEYAKKRLVKLI